MTITPEEQFQKDFSYVVKKIKERSLYSLAGQPVSYKISTTFVDLTGVLPIPENELAIIAKLHESGAIKVISEQDEQGEDPIFELEIDQPKFDEIYNNQKKFLNKSSEDSNPIFEVSKGKIIWRGEECEIPGDLTFQQNDPWTEGQLNQLAQIKHPAVELLVKLKNGSLIAMKEGMAKANLPLEFVKPWVNDEFVAAYLIKPELFETEDLLIRWELPDKYPRLIPSEAGYPIKLISKTDFLKTRGFIIERFYEKLNS